MQKCICKLAFFRILMSQETSVTTCKAHNLYYSIKIRQLPGISADINNYKPLDKPTVKKKKTKTCLMSELSRNNHIDDMTKKWLSKTPNPPRIPAFYTLTASPKASSKLIFGLPVVPWASCLVVCGQSRFLLNDKGNFKSAH